MVAPTRPNTPVYFEKVKKQTLTKKEIALLSLVALVGSFTLYIFLTYAVTADFTWDERIILCVRFSPFVIIPTLLALHLLHVTACPKAHSRIIEDPAHPTIFKRVIKNPLG